VNHTGSNPTNNPETTTVAVIPARYASSRLPGKPLVDIAGKPMICWVAERALAARNVDRVIVATDSEAIVESVNACGFEAVMTAESHTSGTDRVAEVARSIPDAQIFVNLQGDEPLISPATIERAVEQMSNEMSLSDGAGIVTTWEAIDSFNDLMNPDLVKVVIGDDNRAVYFSRSPIPFPRDLIKKRAGFESAYRSEPDFFKLFRKHTGLYVYRRDVLLAFTQWPQTQLEKIEALEQLRALEHGVVIRAIEASSPSTGVDTEQDLDKVRALIDTGKFQPTAVR
jgi:3-deoxy-D-manno-octulosonate cytidylyltransferase